MRVNAGFSRLLRLDGIWVRRVQFKADRVVVWVALRRRRLRCPLCEFSTPHRHNRQQVESVWRHLDLGVWRLELRAQLRRLECPEHGVRVEGVPFARHASGFTRDFEQLVAWLATRADKTTVKRPVRIDWDTVGRIIARVCADELDPDRLHNLFEIGIDEVSWRKQHRYLTLVADHIRGQIVWGTEGNSQAAADRFFADLGKSRSHAVEVISLDMGPGYAKSAREHAPQAIIAIDPYHVVALANRALDEVRRGYWNELRRVGDRDAARRFKDARWSLLKAPKNLNEKQAVTLRRLKAAGGEVWRAYTLKRGAPSDLRTEPERRGRHRADRPVHQQGCPKPPAAIRPPGPNDPPSPRRDPSSDPPRDQPRPHRSAQQQGPAHHPPRLRKHASVWRHLDFGVWRVEVHATLRRLRCPEHGVLVEGVPFARDRARFTRDLDDLIAWLVTRTDKTATCRLTRIDWATIGRVIERVAAEQLVGEDRLAGLANASIDEVAWRKGHRYLTLVGDHDRGCVVWGCEGKGQAAADLFFTELDPEIVSPPKPDLPEPLELDEEPVAIQAEPVQVPGTKPAATDEPLRPVGERAGKLAAVTMDMTGGYAKSVREHAPQAIICIDNFHVVALATKALDEVRRERWNNLRHGGDPAAAKAFKNSRWSLLHNPADLTDTQADTLTRLHAAGGKVPRAWAMKEMVRAIFAPGLSVNAVDVLITRLLARLSRSRLKPFVRLGRTIRKHRDGILAARRLGLSNARAEAMNNRVKLIVRRAYGFHTTRAALALVHLVCGPVTLTLPHEQTLP